jgi:hypothetical protein
VNQPAAPRLIPPGHELPARHTACAIGTSITERLPGGLF